MRARERLADVELRDLPRQRAERLQAVHEDVHVPVAPLETALREEQRLAAHERAIALVHRRRDDEVHLAVLVLEQHEDDALRRRRTLTRDRHPGDAYAAAVAALLELRARHHARRQVRPQQLERMHTDGKGRQAVVGEHSLPRRVFPQRRCLDGWVERQGELPLLAARPWHALRLWQEAELPEEYAPRPAEAVARARCDERLERVLRELR